MSSAGIKLQIAVLSLTFSFMTAARADTPSPPSNSVSMTLYHVVSGNGKQYYLTQNNQAIPLPGAGVKDPKTVAVYTGSQGQQWYVDKSGKQIDLPAVFQGSVQMQASQAQSSNWQSQPDSSFQIDGQNVDAATQAQTQMDSTALATSAYAAGEAAGESMAYANQDDYMDGVPYGMPLYFDSWGAPYYWGADGVRRFVNPNLISSAGWLNPWENQRLWYDHQLNSPYGRYYGQVARNQGPAFQHPDRMANTPIENMASIHPPIAQANQDLLNRMSQDRGAFESSNDLLRGFGDDLSRNGFDRMDGRSFGRMGGRGGGRR